MDTNLIASILKEMAAQSSSSGSVNVNFLMIIVAAVAPTLVALAAYLQAKASKILSEDNAVTLEKVHTAVNSERTAMLEVIKNLRQEMSEMVKGNAVLHEREAAEQRAAILKAEVPPAPPLTEARIIELIKQQSK